MKEQPELKIYEVPVEELVPYAGNAKKHSDYQVDTIAASISEFGNCDPIAVWHNVGGEMEIIEGHGRVMALKKLGIETAPVIFLDHLTDEQRRAYTHVHNQTTLNSEFDDDILAGDMAELDFDWEQFGFEVGADEDDFSSEVEEAVEAFEKGDVPFSEYVDERSDYVVLKFNKKSDWMQAVSVLGLEEVSQLPTRKDGEANREFLATGLSRVIDGVKAFELIGKSLEEMRR